MSKLGPHGLKFDLTPEQVQQLQAVKSASSATTATPSQQQKPPSFTACNSPFCPAASDNGIAAVAVAMAIAGAYTVAKRPRLLRGKSR